MKRYHQIVHDLRSTYPEGEARALARWLCEEGFGLSQTDLLLDKDNQLSADDIENCKEIVSRLLQHEPIQYILGHTTFCGHRFAVGPGVLIPRPETAELVNRIIDYVHCSTAARPHSILDIGTGSGCIALSLALALPSTDVTAWDVSEEALTVARKNGTLHPEAHVRFEQQDILCPTASDRQWDILVSNPPYVRKCETVDMEQNVLRHEPHLALFVPDDDPLLFYRAIARFAAVHLAPQGHLWLEINQALGSETSHLIEGFGFSRIEVLTDSYEHQRFIHAQR